jgi:uncharacterized protein (DUF2147 family)
MRTRLGVAPFLLTLAVTATAAIASPIDGLWLVQEKNAHVRIGLFHGQHCGRIVWVRDSLDAAGKLKHDTKNPDPALRGRVMRDLVMVTDLAPTSADSTRWKGKVYDPKNGHTYSANLTLESPDRLNLHGYVAVSLFGRTARWTRIPEPTAAVDSRPATEISKPGAEDTKPGPAPALHSKR